MEIPLLRGYNDGKFAPWHGLRFLSSVYQRAWCDNIQVGAASCLGFAYMAPLSSKSAVRFDRLGVESAHTSAKVYEDSMGFSRLVKNVLAGVG